MFPNTYHIENVVILEKILREVEKSCIFQNCTLNYQNHGIKSRYELQSKGEKVIRLTAGEPDIRHQIQS